MLLESYPVSRIAFDTLTSVLALTGAEWALFWRITSDGRHMRLLQRLGPSPDTAESGRLSEEFVASVLSGSPLFSSTDEFRENLPDWLGFSDFGYMLPLIAEDSLQGLIVLGPLAAGGTLSTSVEELLAHISHIVAIALGRLESETDLETAGIVTDLDALRREYPPLEQLVGQSEKVAILLRDIVTVAGADCTVLLQGETGTGKQLAAQVIHEMSPRASRPFIELDCNAIPETLLENELFGHVRGAYTGAERKQHGVFQLADGGTLFLDEIGNLPEKAQRRLLRVLQERRFRPIGSENDVSVDVRLVAATNSDLGQALREGTIREDLFYRLYVYPIHLPLLRERLEDIPILARYLLNQAAERNGLSTPRIDEGLLELLTEYRYPGNVRELAHLMERLLIRARKSDLLTADMLDATLAPSLAIQNYLKTGVAHSRLHPGVPNYAVAGVDRGRWVMDLLRSHRFNVSEAAKELSSLSRGGQQPPLTDRRSLTYYFQGEAFRAFLRLGDVEAVAEHLAGDRLVLIPSVRRRINSYLEEVRQVVNDSPSLDHARSALLQRFARLPSDYDDILEELATIIYRIRES